MMKSLIPRGGSLLKDHSQEEFLLRTEVNQIIPVKINYRNLCLYYILGLLTFGLLPMIFIWNKKLWKNFKFYKVAMEEATHLVIIDNHEEEILVKKKHEKDDSGELQTTIVYRYQKYLLHEKEFIQLRNSFRMSHSELLQTCSGLTNTTQTVLRYLFGTNSTKIKVDPVWKVFTEQTLSPFNMYQMFACFVWYFRDYVPYSVIILIFMFISIIFQVVLVRGEQKKINSMSHSNPVTVFRRMRSQEGEELDGGKKTVDSTDLVPGDVILINPDEKVPCDLVMLDGQCLVDESLLTGESVPMLKVNPTKNDVIFSEDNKEHIVFAGTFCLTSVSNKSKEEPAKAIVYQTGFSTTKGRLIRSIMFNNPSLYRFEKDSNFFTLYLFIIAVCFMIAYYIIIFTKFPANERKLSEIIFPSLDIILTMVPPGLSLSLSIGIEYSQERLKKAGIIALKGRLINAAGRMKAVFFDKTGTLTINEMKLNSVILNDIDSQGAPSLIDLEHGKGHEHVDELHKVSHLALMKNFASNHSLSNINGKILGDPMEEEMFAYAGGDFSEDNTTELTFLKDQKYLKKVHLKEIAQELRKRQATSLHNHEHRDSNVNTRKNSAAEDEEINPQRKRSSTARRDSLTSANASATHNDLCISIPHLSPIDEESSTSPPIYIVGLLDFKSSLQRMSVLVRDSSANNLRVYTKGAPEKVLKLCRPETIPEKTEEVLKRLADNGYRILAFGTTEFPAETPLTNPREFYESKLRFQGLAIFKNNLKDETKPTITKLKKAEFKVGMITGDNINTAISIATNCGIMDPDLENIGTYSFADNELKFEKTEGIDKNESFELNSDDEDSPKVPKPSKKQMIVKTNSKSQPLKKKRAGAINSENFSKIVSYFDLEEATAIDLSNPVIKELASSCSVFARMTPEQKALIVKIMKTFYKEYEITVGFCGDGANDCIALKEADIGVSLSKTEASLSAPFISNIEDISCIEFVSTEGKSALTTNFDCFRFFCLYSVIQSIGLIMLFSMKTEFSTGVYICCDIFVALNLANCMGLLRPRSFISPHLPKCTLFYKEFIYSIFWNCILASAFYFGGLYIVPYDKNYKTPYQEEAGQKDVALHSELATYEGTVS